MAKRQTTKNTTAQKEIEQVVKEEIKTIEEEKIIESEIPVCDECKAPDLYDPKPAVKIEEQSKPQINQFTDPWRF